MKPLLFTVAALCFSLLSLAQDAATSSYRPLPQVDIQNLQGNPFNTKSISNDGKPVIICFWATWCKPCIKELDAIADVYDDWVEETGVKLYAVSIDDSRSTQMVAPRVNGKGWEYTVLLDPNQDFKRAMNVTVPPHTFVLNGKGEIVWEHATYVDGNELEYIDVVKRLLRGESISQEP